MRARYPDTEGFVERDGVKVAYEVFGSGEPAPSGTSPCRVRRRHPRRRPARRAHLSRPTPSPGPGLPEPLRRLAGLAEHVRQPVLTGEPGGSPEFRPGLLALVQPDQGAAVRRER